MDPVIKFESQPTPEQVATAQAQGTATIPTAGGVVIVLESDGNNKPTATGKKTRKRRHEEPDVQVVHEPTVRFPEYLKRPPPIDTKLLELRRHVMISQVNYYTASTRFFEQASSLIPHIKRMIADMPWGKGTAQKKESEHDYAFPGTSTGGQTGNESDVDI